MYKLTVVKRRDNPAMLALLMAVREHGADAASGPSFPSYPPRDPSIVLEKWLTDDEFAAIKKGAGGDVMLTDKDRELESEEIAREELAWRNKNNPKAVRVTLRYSDGQWSKSDAAGPFFCYINSKFSVIHDENGSSWIMPAWGSIEISL